MNLTFSNVFIDFCLMTTEELTFPGCATCRQLFLKWQQQRLREQQQQQRFKQQQ